MGNNLSNRLQRGRSRERNKNDNEHSEVTNEQCGLKGRLRRFSRSIGIRPKSRSSNTKMNTIRKVVQEQESKTSVKSSSSSPILETPTGDILLDLHHQETRKDDIDQLSVIQECRSEEEVQSRGWTPPSQKAQVVRQPAAELPSSTSRAPWYSACCGCWEKWCK